MSHHRLTDEQLAEFQEAFDVYDLNGDGFISSKELALVMRSIGHNATEAELQRVINKMLKDKKDGINFREFIRVMGSKIMAKITEKEIYEAFVVFNRDETGGISHDEIKHVLINLGENITDEEINEMMLEVDTDGDGLINYKDFLDVMLID
ncbi:calmodulin-A-like [Teleopsis dalmanni]|uniref:calmodulin-A-like n=1 Tax=Teleopsis dalmanni TaxID=139649 RepID=UPI0018CD8D62|nr:calmodulin-A-like [Teleopsis dalmanni]